MNSLPALKIAHVDTGMTLRGGQRQLLLLAEGLRACGHDQLIVCPEGSGLEAQSGGQGLKVFTLPPNDPAHALGIMLLRQQIKTLGTEILHAHDGRGHTVAWFASAGLPVRRVASRRVTFFPADRWTYRLKYGHTCDAVITVSEFIRDLAVRGGVPREHIEVIPDGIELPATLPSAADRARLRKAWQIEEGNFVVGQLGALSAEKGQEVAVAALGRLADKLPHVRLVLAGEGMDAAQGPVAAMIEPWRERIRLLGNVTDLADFFPGLDLFLMPSKSEGLGSSALWAMAYGLPVIASRVGGLPEVVAENETGWLVAPDSAEALAEAILVAASDLGRLRQFGSNGRLRAGNFTVDIMVRRTEALYRRVLADHSNGAPPCALTSD